MREDLKVRWDAVISKVDVRKERVDKFISFLEQRTSYFVAPCIPQVSP